MFLRASAALVLACLSLAACGGVSAHLPANAPVAAADEVCALDGKSYEITMTLPGDEDTLSFAGGRFESSASTPLGFPRWTRYEARKCGNSVEFHVLTRHPDGTIVEWNGAVKGDTVEGTATRILNGRAATTPFVGMSRT